MIPISSRFTQGLLATITNSNTDDLALPWRHRASLSDLSMNNNFIIIPSDKGGGIVIMNCTHYNNKLGNLLMTHTNKILYKPWIKTLTILISPIKTNHLRTQSFAFTDYHPLLSSKIYDLKTHELRITLQTIISGIVSAHPITSQNLLPIYK